MGAQNSDRRGACAAGEPGATRRTPASFPNRPIRVIVPVGAGAGIDTAARVTATAAEKHLGGKFVIENKPGASQRLGASMVAKSPPDGYTLLFTSPSPIVVAAVLPAADGLRSRAAICGRWSSGCFSRCC